MSLLQEIDEALRALPFGREVIIPNEQEMFLSSLPEDILDDPERGEATIKKLFGGEYATLHEVIQDFCGNRPSIEIVDDDELDDDEWNIAIPR